MGSIDKACISGFLCRLCSEMHRIVIHIYGDQGQRLCLVEKINGYLPITISPTDPLPKTICTTCLRRVEQHYDLLMRLSRIKEERFLRLNKEHRRRIDEMPHVSSIENSDDEVYHSDDYSRRRNQDQLPQLQQQTSSVEPSSSTVLAISTNSSSFIATHADSDDEDGGSTASTSSNPLTALTQNIITLVDSAAATAVSSSSTNHSRSMEAGSSFVDNVVGGNSFGVVLQHNHD